MAPTVCFIDYPIVGSDASSSTRTRIRSCRDGIISKRQRLTLKHFPKIAEGIHTPVSSSLSASIREADTPSHPMLPEANLPDDSTTQRTSVTNRRKELLDIVLRTLALVRRNYVLQVRLDSLRLEANNFFQSMLNNPKNKESQKKNDKPTSFCHNISHLGVSSNDNENNSMNDKQINNLSISNENLNLKPPIINKVAASTCVSSSDDKSNDFNSCNKLNAY